MGVCRIGTETLLLLFLLPLLVRAAWDLHAFGGGGSRFYFVRNQLHPKFVAALLDDAPFTAWGKWFPSTDPARSIAPGFKVTPEEAAKLARELAAMATPMATPAITPRP